MALWGANTGCPNICTCKLEHLTETPIHRFMQTHKNRPMHGEALSVELNDVSTLKNSPIIVHVHFSSVAVFINIEKKTLYETPFT